MKKIIILIIGIFSLLIIRCTKNPNTLITNALQQQDSAKVILSIPDWALGKYVLDGTQSTCGNLDSLKALRGYDNVLYKTLLETQPVGKYVLTRKYNPCCPCTGKSGATCCQCLTTMLFSSPSTMRVSMRIGNNGLQLTKDTIQHLDFFTIPANVQADTLVIDGRGICAPLRFVMAN